jgi:hypothetical protein
MQTVASTRLKRIEKIEVDAVETNPAPCRSTFGVGHR